MGSGNVDVKKLDRKAKEAQSTKNSGFSATKICDEFDPKRVGVRDSKKGPFNEFRDPITVLVGLDVTGSMGQIPKDLLTGDLSKLIDSVKKLCNKPNENVQISFAGIGDVKSDQAPLQVTHFESDNRFAEQLEKIWLEGNGGPLGEESYNLLWWYAANKTKLNYVAQDQRKGILITMGDEDVYKNLTAADIRKCFDAKYDGGDVSNEVILEELRKQYEVYHLLITNSTAYKPKVGENWKKILGEKNVISTTSRNVAIEIANIITLHRPPEKANMQNLSEEEWRKNNFENLTDNQWLEVLSYTLCPLSGKYMEVPRELGNSKRVYEEKAIKEHLKTHKIDPFTQEKLPLVEQALKPNLNIAQLCKMYQPSFELLSEERKTRLVKEALEQKKVEFKVEPKKVNNNNNVNVNLGKSSMEFFGNKTKMEENIEKIIECPIGHEPMRDPVMLSSGHTFERKNIEKWLENHNTNPITNEVLKDTTLTTNWALKPLCEQWHSQKLDM